MTTDLAIKDEANVAKSSINTYYLLRYIILFCLILKKYIFSLYLYTYL